MTETPSERRMPGLGRLWWGLAAAPVAWVLTELVGYPFAARSCEPGANGLGVPGIANPRAWIVGLTALLTMMAISGLWIAIRSVRATMHVRAERASPPPHSVTGERTAALGRAHFMAVAGVFVSSIFLGGTVLYGLPSLIVNVCAQVR